MPHASQRRLCRVLQVPRSGLRPTRPLNAELVTRVTALIQAHPTFGYRRLWALLRFREGHRINRKAVYRVRQHQGWLVHQRSGAPRPHVHGRWSVAPVPNTRWAVAVTYISCGADGWAHLTAVVDCHDRAVVGYEFALRGRAQEAEPALEAACLRRFGTVRPRGPTPTLRSDNGLVIQSRRVRAACRTYRLRQEVTTPDPREQNGVIARFFRSLKEECIWQHVFTGYPHARQVIRRWIAWYNTERPHQALQHLSPAQYRACYAPQVA